MSFSLLPRPQNYPEPWSRELRSIFSWGGNRFISENVFSIHIWGEKKQSRLRRGENQREVLTGVGEMSIKTNKHFLNLS